MLRFLSTSKRALHAQTRGRSTAKAIGKRRREKQLPIPLRLEQLESRITPSYTLTTLASPVQATGRLIMDSHGNLYGVSQFGGVSGIGSVFEVAKSGMYTQVSFDGTTNGFRPLGDLAIDGSGNLYGATFGYPGTVFEVLRGSANLDTLEGATIETLASFRLPGGLNPDAGVVMDTDGNLYGTTPIGGAYGDGTVFEVAHGSGSITTLASFNRYARDPENNLIGRNPQGGLVLYNGDLYGTTRNGGAADVGTVDSGPARSSQTSSTDFKDGGRTPQTEN
jgi:uncharacterized repeat protein (TIGR03803 family)